MGGVKAIATEERVQWKEGNDELCTSKILAALESSVFFTLQRAKVRMRVAVPSSLLESRLPRLFKDSMACISFSLLASSFWPEIPTKLVFIGRQWSRLQLTDVEWKLPEDVSASPRAMSRGCDGTGDAGRLCG